MYYPLQPAREKSDLYIHYWGREECAPAHAVGPGIREMYKVHFIHDGEGIVKVGQETFALSAGQAFMIYPHIVTYYKADSVKPWTYSWIAFDGLQAAAILERTRLSPELPVFSMDLKVMPALFDSLTETLAHEESWDLHTASILYRFLAELVEAAPMESAATLSPRKQDVYVHQFVEYLHSHYSEPISMAEIAGTLGLDRKYLSLLFKQALGVPPQQYLLQYRMERASGLLEKGIYSIGEVARSVGYQDALLFSRMFKKVKGVSPRNSVSRQKDDIMP